MIGSTLNQRSSAVERILLRQPSAATDNHWRVEIHKSEGTTGCYDALNASFAPENRDAAETYARRMMRIFQTERLDRVA